MLSVRIQASQSSRAARRLRLGCCAMLAVAWGPVCWGQGLLPNAPTPHVAMAPASAAPETLAEVPPAEMGSSWSTLPAGWTLFGSAAQETFPPMPRQQRLVRMPGVQPSYIPLPQRCYVNACMKATPSRSCCEKQLSPSFAYYLEHNAPHIYTPRELGLLAVHGVSDPFNLLTILYTSAYTVATDSHSPYGPGVMGISKLSGVSLTQDMTGEFFGTFLIPSIDHQDPHYHRMPNASLKRRIAHCIYQVFWTDSDTGKGMVNYSTIAGAMADEAVGIMYVPYQRTGWGPSAARIATNWATGPIGNFVTEFVPDVARHINLNVVFVQRIINRVAIEEGGGSAP